MSNDIALESEDVKHAKVDPDEAKRPNKRERTNERACFNVYQRASTND